MNVSLSIDPAVPCVSRPIVASQVDPKQSFRCPDGLALCATSGSWPPPTRSSNESTHFVELLAGETPKRRGVRLVGAEARAEVGLRSLQKPRNAGSQIMKILVKERLGVRRIYQSCLCLSPRKRLRRGGARGADFLTRRGGKSHEK